METVHGDIIDNADEVKYLGDDIDKSGKVKASIEKRKAKGYGIASEITAITDDIPLGQWRIQAGIMLRQAMLVNGTLFNSECWQGNSVSKDICSLNKPDEALHRSLVTAHAKTQLEFLHLEFGTVPMNIIHAGRRANYLQYILQKDSNELIKEVYLAQKTNSSPGDFCELVFKDLNTLKCHMTEGQIKSMSEEKYKQ